MEKALAQSQGGSQALAQSQSVDLTQEAEKRIAEQDGLAYTYREYVRWFGKVQGDAEWQNSLPAASEKPSPNKTGDTKSSSEHPEMPKTPLACAEPPSDHDQQQQDAKDTLELQAKNTSASSSADTAAEATHQSTAVQTVQLPDTKIKRIFQSLNAKCTQDPETGHWSCPDTGDAETESALWKFHWDQMVGRDDIKSIVPTFYPMEADANQQGKPRLDLLVTFENGASVRYHPKAKPIWSSDSQPTDAMQNRMRYKEKLMLKHADQR